MFEEVINGDNACSEQQVKPYWYYTTRDTLDLRASCFTVHNTRNTYLRRQLNNAKRFGSRIYNKCMWWFPGIYMPAYHDLCMDQLPTADDAESVLECIFRCIYFPRASLLKRSAYLRCNRRAVELCDSWMIGLGLSAFAQVRTCCS